MFEFSREGLNFEPPAPIYRFLYIYICIHTYAHIKGSLFLSRSLFLSATTKGLSTAFWFGSVPVDAKAQDGGLWDG